MDDFELSPDKAHPNAKKLLTENFYWSPIDETGPFGSDDGSDCFYGFVEWRTENKNESPVTYLKELIDEWGYSTFDLNVTDSQQIKQLLSTMDPLPLLVFSAASPTSLRLRIFRMSYVPFEDYRIRVDGATLLDGVFI